MRSAPARFLIEVAVLVAFAYGLHAVDVSLTVFIVGMALVFIGVAVLERTMLQPGGAAEPLSDDALPVHEAGVEREVPAGAFVPEPEPAGEAAEPGLREGVRRVAEEEPDLAAAEPWEEPALEPEPVQEAPVAEVSEPDWEPEPEPVPVVVVEEVTTVAVLESEPEPVVVVEELTTVAIVEPEPEPERPPVQLTAAPPLPPEPEPEPALARARSTVVELPTRGPREWNLWDLERRARERTGADPFRDEEWAALFVYLREYASPDGMLPPEFDDLVRESFGDLLLAGRT